MPVHRRQQALSPLSRYLPAEVNLPIIAQRTVYQVELGLVLVLQFARHLSAQRFVDFRCDTLHAGQSHVDRIVAGHLKA